MNQPGPREAIEALSLGLPVLEWLALNGPADAATIAKDMNLSYSAARSRLVMLEHTGLASHPDAWERRQTRHRTHIYSANHAGIRIVAGWLDMLADQAEILELTL